MTLLPAIVISKRRGAEPERHYLCGPQRETRQEAEADLAAWESLSASPGAALDSRPFPIILDRNHEGVPRSIPWWIAEAAYRQYVRLYGSSQTLAERGGFHWSEIGLLLAEGMVIEGSS